jgi:hypothetical protein
MLIIADRNLHSAGRLEKRTFSPNKPNLVVNANPGEEERQLEQARRH